MKFDLQTDSKVNLISHFDDQHFMINERRFTNSLIVTSDFVDHWQIDNLDELSSQDFEQLLIHRPELVLLGTGASAQFPHPSISQPLIQAQIGLEVMDTASACRTFNVLADDHRRVAALLFLG